jgi:hypothetical protein
MSTEQFKAQLETLRVAAVHRDRANPRKQLPRPIIEVIAGCGCTMHIVRSPHGAHWMLEIQRVAALGSNLSPELVDLIAPKLAELAGAKPNATNPPDASSDDKVIRFQWWPNGDRVIDLQQAAEGLKRGGLMFAEALARFTLAEKLDELGSCALECATSARIIADSMDELASEAERRLCDADHMHIEIAKRSPC